jgi:chromosomal replication initiation ATPase DnaA
MRAGLRVVPRKLPKPPKKVKDKADPDESAKAKRLAANREMYQSAGVLVDYVSDLCGLNAAMVRSSSRAPAALKARQVCAYILCKRFGMSGPDAALIIRGDKSQHGTVFGCIDRVEAGLVDPESDVSRLVANVTAWLEAVRQS